MADKEWKPELQAGILWRVVRGTEVWGCNHPTSGQEAVAVAAALNAVARATTEERALLAALPEVLSQDPGTHSGDIVFAGTRVPIRTLLDHLPELEVDEFLLDYPTVSLAQVRAVLEVLSRPSASAAVRAALDDITKDVMGDPGADREAAYQAWAKLAREPRTAAEVAAETEEDLVRVRAMLERREVRNAHQEYDAALTALARSVSQAPAATMTEAELIAAASEGKRTRRKARRSDPHAEFEDALEPRDGEHPAIRRAREAGIDIEQLRALARLTPEERVRCLDAMLELRDAARRADKSSG